MIEGASLSPSLTLNVKGTTKTGFPDDFLQYFPGYIFSHGITASNPLLCILTKILKCFIYSEEGHGVEYLTTSLYYWFR